MTQKIITNKGDCHNIGRHITLPCYGIVIDITENGDGACITSDLHKAPMPSVDSDERERERQYDACMDAIESIVLAHVIAGVDVPSPAYIEGIESAVQACANHY
jgi:hypothetical protein